MTAKEQTYTPGPWRIGKVGSCVVADHPAPGISGSDDVEYYGGHLICESVSLSNSKLIATAPEMLKLLEAVIHDLEVPTWLLNAINNVISKAT